MRATERVQVGDAAPDFTLPDGLGQPVTLSSFRGRKVVLFFYPKDDTRGCIAQACAFRDAYEGFLASGAEVIGISSDSVASHRGFAEKHALPYRLLSDEGGQVRKRFGVPKTLGFLPGRVTYVIDKDGIVRHVFSSQLNVAAHVGEALEALKGE
jgi:thioredoxin-dependent peroxiredoxin